MKKIVLLMLFLPVFVYSKTSSDSIANAQIVKIEYGLLLKNKYLQTDLSENEKKILEELEKLKDEFEYP